MTNRTITDTRFKDYITAFAISIGFFVFFMLGIFVMQNAFGINDKNLTFWEKYQLDPIQQQLNSNLIDFYSNNMTRTLTHNIIMPEPNVNTTLPNQSGDLDPAICCDQFKEKE